jgi:hypothetical protein
MEPPSTDDDEAVRSDGDAIDAPMAPPRGAHTLAPPEWNPPPEAKSLFARLLPPPPVPRRTGDRADEARLRALLETARRTEDGPEERMASIRLARWLAARERDLDEATTLAFHALRLREDRELRRELASWLESLGEPGLASSELRKLAQSFANDPQQASRLLVRVGVLHARAGDAPGARDAFEEAAKLDPGDALAHELRGALFGWAPDAMSARESADAYVDAAARRAAAPAPDAELEDLLRAFEADSSSDRAAMSLAKAFVVRGKVLAADEVLRAHAALLRDQGARIVHATRRAEAAAAGDMTRSLGASIDARVDAEFEGADADAFDDLLVRLGLLEPYAARLQIRAERKSLDDGDRARAFADLARLYSGSLSSPARAFDAQIRAAIAGGDDDDAGPTLRALLVSSRDPMSRVMTLARKNRRIRERVRAVLRARMCSQPSPKIPCRIRRSRRGRSIAR